MEPDMHTISLPKSLLAGAFLLASGSVFAQSSEKAKPSAPIVGKASASKAAQPKAKAERKRYEFTGAAAGATQRTGPTGAQVAPSDAKEKSGCHLRASDA
jgi:hypothetical protein